MREVLSAVDDPMECCKRLTDLANAAGGHDNVTVIVARFDGDVPPVGADDELFGYQPYVITEQMEPAPAARASGKIKDADAPPPGKDVKYAVSLRPPPNGAPVAMRPDSAGGGPMVNVDEDGELQVPMRVMPRTWIAAALVALALAILALAGVLLLRSRSGGEAPPVGSSAPRRHASASHGAASSVSTAIAPPTGWTSDASHAAAHEPSAAANDAASAPARP
jgi:protein phosphatase